jgi:hypothetical protein
VLLREQASLLGERTKGLVLGEVESSERPVEGFETYVDEALSAETRVVHSHTLYLVAPALDNYQYALLSVEHDFQPYPCRGRFHPVPVEGGEGIGGEDEGYFTNPASISSEHTFVDWLRIALSQRETTRVIHALIYRVQGLGKV